VGSVTWAHKRSNICQLMTKYSENVSISSTLVGQWAGEYKSNNALDMLSYIAVSADMMSCGQPETGRCTSTLCNITRADVANMDVSERTSVHDMIGEDTSAALSSTVEPTFTGGIIAVSTAIHNRSKEGDSIPETYRCTSTIRNIIRVNVANMNVSERTSAHDMIGENMSAASSSTV